MLQVHKKKKKKKRTKNRENHEIVSLKFEVPFI